MAAKTARSATKLYQLLSYQSTFNFSQHAFDTQSQSFVRMIGRCANNSKLLSDESFVSRINTNEPQHIDHIDIIDLILYTNKIITKHIDSSHLSSYHYFQHLFNKTVSTLNSSCILQSHVFNDGISIDTIKHLLNSIDVKENREIFKCIVNIVSKNELLLGDFNCYGTIIYILAPITIKYQNEGINYDLMWKNILSVVDRYEIYTHINNLSLAHLCFGLSIIKNHDTQSPINTLNITNKILEYVEHNIDLNTLKGNQIKHLIQGLIHSNTFLTKLCTHLSNQNNIKMYAFDDLIAILNGMHFITDYDVFTKKLNQFITQNRLLFINAIKSINHELYELMSIKHSQGSLSALFSSLSYGYFDDKRLIVLMDKIVVMKPNNELCSACLWCHAVNDIEFEDNVVFEKCVKELMMIGNHDIDYLIRGGYGMLMIYVNKLVSKQYDDINIDLIARYFTHLWSELKVIKNTTYDRYIGSILRCNLVLKLLNIDICLLNDDLVKDLENKFETNYGGSRIEKVLIDYLYDEYKQNTIWIDNIECIKRNVVMDNQVIECDIVIYLKDDKKKDIIVDVLGSHHYLILSNRECGKTKLLNWIFQRMNYNVYKVDVRDFKKINKASFIKNVEKLLIGF